jgi:hypothetical protein
VEDMPCEKFLDLPMAWNGLGYAGFRVLIPIVPTAVPDQETPFLFQLAN